MGTERRTIRAAGAVDAAMGLSRTLDFLYIYDLSRAGRLTGNGERSNRAKGWSSFPMRRERRGNHSQEAIGRGKVRPAAT